MEKEKLHIAVIYGSVRTERQGIKAAKFIVNKIKERGHEVTLIDPGKLEIPMLEKTYGEYEKGKAPGDLDKIEKIISKADAYIIVSAEYNHNPPPALTNLIDYFFQRVFLQTLPDCLIFRRTFRRSQSSHSSKIPTSRSRHVIGSLHVPNIKNRRIFR